MDQEIIYVFQNNFWEGFAEETDAVTYSFFLDLISRVFDKPVDKTDDPDRADVLLESIGNHGINSYVHYKLWKYRILFSGESRLCPHHEYYDCVLWGKPSEGKIVCCPFVIPFLISSGAIHKVREMEQKSKIGEIGSTLPPNKKILAIISNPNSTNRNFILNILERYFLVDYAGRYRTNRPPIPGLYFGQEFWHDISQYRCVLCLENTKDTEYLTEKIIHGMATGIVPIYWGSSAVTNYFNPARFIHIKEINEDSIHAALNQIKRIMEDDTYYRDIVNQPIFANGMDASMVENHIERIVKEMRGLLGLNIPSI